MISRRKKRLYVCPPSSGHPGAAPQTLLQQMDCPLSALPNAVAASLVCT